MNRTFMLLLVLILMAILLSVNRSSYHIINMSCDRDTVCYSHSILFSYSDGLKYQYGMVAYLNGIEVYRDNMSDGQPSIDTLASDSYSSCDYRGVIRSASDVSVSNVLAVEVHFSESNHEEMIQFNGFISLLAGMNSTNNCFVYPVISLFWYQLLFHHQASNDHCNQSE